MLAHTKFDLTQAFALRASDLEKIWLLISGDGWEVTASVHCNDGIVRKFTELKPLLEYENSPRSQITSIDLGARSIDYRSSSEVTFGARHTAPIGISLRGEESTITSLRTSITDVLDGTKPWYSKIATFDLFYLWWPVLTISFIALSMVNTPSNPKPEMDLRRSIGLTLKAILLFSPVAFLIWGVAKLRNKFFPVSTFAIGQGLDRHNLLEQFRWVVIVGFAVSVAASLFLAPWLAA